MNKTPDPNAPSGFNFELTQAERDSGRILFLTGPISGTMTMADGGSYDVTEYAIPVKAEHETELKYAIHKAHHAAGRFLDHPLPPDPKGQ